MYEKRKDNKGQVLRNGEVQRENGQYMYRYIDADGRRRTLYSRKLVETDKLPKGKRGKLSLREMDKAAIKDVTVLLGIGACIGEVLGLRWCDCDFDKSIIQIDHALLYKQSEVGGYRYRISSHKTMAGYRVIPMLSQVKSVLEEERSKQPISN